MSLSLFCVTPHTCQSNTCVSASPCYPALMGKVKSSSKRPTQKKPCGVYKGHQLYRHKKPDQCRQQIVDAFSKKIRTLPAGEIGVLVVLPADIRGPVRVSTHGITIQQAAETATALNNALPYKQKRLSGWAREALRQQRKSCNNHKQKRSKHRSCRY